MGSPGDESSEVIEITPAQLHKARRQALRALGCSYEELSEMARTGQYESLQHRLAWIAYGG